MIENKKIWIKKPNADKVKGIDWFLMNGIEVIDVSYDNGKTERYHISKVETIIPEQIIEDEL